MNKLAQKLEIASHVAILLVAVLISVVLVKTYLIPGPKTKNDVRDAPLAAKGMGEAEIVGKKISLSDVDWTRNDRTIVMALSTGCRFCTESASFYKQLAQKRAEQGKVRLIAVLPQPIEAGRKYLSELGVSVDEVRQLPPSSIGVHGTPTLLLVSKEGVVTGAWKGKLSPDKELEVLGR
jgi:hypothetical protein